MFLLHGSIKWIQWKTTEKKWRHHFLNYKCMGVLLRRSRAANSVVGGPIWPKFELIHNIKHVLVTSKFEKDRININGDYVMTLILRHSRAANSIVSGGICPKFKLIWAFMYVLITCKYEKDPIKNSRENVMTSFFPLQVYGNFFRRSRAANSVVSGHIWPKFELIQDYYACPHYLQVWKGSDQ